MFSGSGIRKAGTRGRCYSLKCVYKGTYFNKNKGENMKGIQIDETDEMKVCTSPEYNYIFNKRNGNFIRWGKTRDDDPVMAPAFEILDWEISTVCHGPYIKGKERTPCAHCYKANGPRGIVMSLQTFKYRFDLIKKINPLLTQIALGIGSIDAIPDLFPMMQYCRDNGIIPNITVNGDLTLYDIKRFGNLAGAVSISNYDTPTTIEIIDICAPYIKQLNVHQVLAKETLEECYNLIDHIDPSKIHALVLLWIKPKGRASEGYNFVTYKELHALIKYALSKGITLGFDSCSAPYIWNFPEFKDSKESIEPCESGLFSLYLSASGYFYPCSFAEGMVHGIAIDDVKHIDQIWHHPDIEVFRRVLQSSNRNCPCYKLDPREEKNDCSN